MSDGSPKRPGPLLVPTGIAELHQRASSTRFVETLSGMPALAKGSVSDFKVAAGESLGFKFLTAFGPRAVRAFKLLEVAQSKASYDETARLNTVELGLLTRLIGADFVALACRAYEECKELTHDPENLRRLDERSAWRLTEFIHLYDNVMALGHQRGTLKRSQETAVLSILLRDFGAYYGLLVDDVERTQQESIAMLIDTLQAFRQTELYRPELPVDQMNRLSLQAPLSVNLLDYEIARAIEAHPIAVRERIIRGNDEGGLADEHPVEFTHHQLTVVYSRDLDAEGRAIVNAVLPVFAISAFDGFPNLDQVERHLARRRQVIQQAEKECFALLQCLQHFGGRVPPSMKEFRAADVMKAARTVYRQRERQRGDRRPKAVTAGGMLKERLNSAVQSVTSPISFAWSADRTVFQLPGFPDGVVFFPQSVEIRMPDGATDTYTFLCHARRDVDPQLETPLMVEYQAVLDDTQFFDAHSALRDHFVDAPDTFRRTLDAGPVVLFAKATLFADEVGAGGQADLEEVRVLGTYVALNGGMKSWVGQYYLLSQSGANAFIRYADVKQYLSTVVPGDP